MIPHNYFDDLVSALRIVVASLGKPSLTLCPDHTRVDKGMDKGVALKTQRVVRCGSSKTTDANESSTSLQF
jgi:hypothetical protein